MRWQEEDEGDGRDSDSASGSLGSADAANGKAVAGRPRHAKVVSLPRGLMDGELRKAVAGALRGARAGSAASRVLYFENLEGAAFGGFIDQKAAKAFEKAMGKCAAEIATGYTGLPGIASRPTVLSHGYPHIPLSTLPLLAGMSCRASRAFREPGAALMRTTRHARLVSGYAAE